MSFATLFQILILVIFASMQSTVSQCAEVATPLQTINAPTFNGALSGLNADILTLGFDWGRTTTRNVTPVVNTGNCFFLPTPNAYPETDACYSAFTIGSSFSSLTANPACGTTSVNQGSPAAKLWRIPLTLSGNETFFDARGTQQNRILVYPLLIQIGFPEFVTAQVALNAYAPVLLDAFIISQIYSLDTKKATIIFNTVIGFPFKLVLGIPNIAISLTEVTGFAANVNNNVPNELATIAGTQSKQTWILEITPPTPACTFTGDYNITGFVIVCVDPQNCPTINNNQVAVNLVIESENFCAQTSAVVGVVPTLTAYSDSSFQNPGVNFLVDDIPVQSAYFDMTVTSTAVTISGITITTIRISSSSSILFAPGGTPTTAVTIFNNGTWINGINGLVGIQSLVPGSARFKFDMVSALFNIPVDTAAQIVVQVTSSVRYLGGKKRSIASSDDRLDDRKRSYEEEFVTEYVVDLADGQQPEVYSLALGIKGPKGKAEVSPNVPSGAMGLNMNLVFVGLLALSAFIAVSVFIVLVVVLVRNRKQSDDKKEYERAVNNDDLVASEMQSLDEISI